MFNIFEQPWTLLTAAAVISLVLAVLRTIWPEKKCFWHWLIPAAVVAAAFALDFLVQTDMEKIRAVIDTGIKTVERENAVKLGQIISNDYKDSYHNTKENLMRYCRELFSEPLVEKNKLMSLDIKLSTPRATAVLDVWTTFDRRSYVYQNYKPFLMTEMELQLQRQPDKKWLITRAEILELDNQPAGWRQLR